MSKLHNVALASESASFKKLNPHLFGQPVAAPARPVAENKRIRQGEPKQGKWEQEWKFFLEIGGWSHVRAQSIRVRLANGAWYKGDVSAISSETGRCHIWEVKGGAKMKGVAKGVLALKVAATQYPEICWTLVWKEKGIWKSQEVLP